MTVLLLFFILVEVLIWGWVVSDEDNFFNWFNLHVLPMFRLLTVSLLLTLWFLFTLLLTCTIFGLIVVIDDESSWSDIGRGLMNELRESFPKS